MIFRYKKLFFLQACFLCAGGVVLYRLCENFSPLWSSIFFWPIFVSLNLLFLGYFALPSQSVLKALSTEGLQEDMTWSMIEATIQQKDQDLMALQHKYELENLKYKTLLDSLLDPIFIFDEDLNVTYANYAFEAFFHFPLENIPASLIEISRNLEFQKILRSAKAQGEILKINNFSFNQIQDPHKVYFEIKIFPLKNLTGHLCLMHDITAMKMADLMREDFVANFSHEVRTPLTIINGQLQNLRQSLANVEMDQQRLVPIFDRLEHNSRRLINLFNDLLRLTSIEKKIEIQKEMVNIVPMIEMLTADLAANYLEKKVQFNLEINQNSFFVDYNLFEQILINLIDNALKYTDQEGQVSIKTYSETLNSESWDVLEIADNGIGIPEEQVHRIFERFFRVDASRSSEKQGTGLGLSIVKHIIQKHGGKIKAASKPKIGTVFTLFLPTKN